MTGSGTNISNFNRQLYEEFHTNKLENTHKIDNFLGKYYLTIRNQEENKNLNRTKTVKKKSEI